jgi:hypothetical protein
MSEKKRTLLDTITDLLRSTALSHADAYREYAEALERYGRGEINSGTLFKTAGDLYIREASGCGSQTIKVASEAYEWLLRKADPRTLPADDKVPETEVAGGGRARSSHEPN